MESNKQDNRNYLLDNLKGLLIFLVVFGHSLELYKNEDILVNIIYTFIYLFHMPVFVFVSGYFSKNLDRCRSTAFKTFLIPFVIFNTLWNGLAAIFMGPAAFSFVTPGWALWYLMSMFLWRILIKDLVKIKYIFPLSILMGLSAGIFSDFDALLSLSRTLVFLPFFLAGYYTSEHGLAILKKPSRLYSFCITVIAVIFAVFIAKTNIIPVEFLYGSSPFKTYTVPIWIGMASRALLYVIGFSFVFGLINVMKQTPTFFSKIGSNTFSIYILHTYLLIVAFGINSFIPWLPVRILVCFIDSIGITYFLSRNKVNRYFMRLLNWINRKVLKN